MPSSIDSFEVGVWAIICASGGMILVLLARIFSRASGSGLRSTGAVRGISTRAQRDGFWIDAPRLGQGSTVAFTYEVRGARRHGSVVFDAASRSQFVYTGDSPERIAIGRVESPDAGPSAPVDDDDDRSTSSTSFSSPSPPAGFPPAY